MTSRTARGWHGHSRAPLSPRRHEEAKAANTLGWGGIGAIVGGMLGGPPGAAFGALVGGGIGNSIEPDEELLR